MLGLQVEVTKLDFRLRTDRDYGSTDLGVTPAVSHWVLGTEEERMRLLGPSAAGFEERTISQGISTWKSKNVGIRGQRS